MSSQAAIKSRFFANLARFCVGETSYAAVIQHLRRSPDATMREWASWLAPKAHEGAEASLAWRPDLFSVLDREIVSSGEYSGHLSEAFQYLSQFYLFVARTESKLYDALRIPAFLLVGGTMAITVIQSVISGGMHYFWMHFGPPIFAWGLGVAGIFLFARWGIRESAKNIQADQFLRCLPILGRAWQILTESRFALVFSLRIQGGMPMISCLRLSGSASRSALIQQRTQQAIVAIKKTRTSLPEIFQRQRLWSPLFLNTLYSGEANRGMEIFQVSRDLQQQAMNQIEAICNQVPNLASLMVVLLLFWKIFALFSH